MYFLILKKNKLKKNSYNLLLYNKHKQIKKKIGILGYNSGVNRFTLILNILILCYLLKKGVYFGLDFYKILNKVINNIKI